MSQCWATLKFGTCLSREIVPGQRCLRAWYSGVGCTVGLSRAGLPAEGGFASESAVELFLNRDTQAPALEILIAEAR